MYKRQRILLYLLDSLKRNGRNINKTLLDKLLFVLNKEYFKGSVPGFYNFYPHNYGPFSNNFYFDLQDAKSRGFVGENLGLTPEGLQEAEPVKLNEKTAVEEVVMRFSGQKAAVDYVYEKYPEYTVKSKLKNNNGIVPMPGIFSIGYEGKDIDLFLDLLIQNSIQVLIDVRANPFSMKLPFTGSRLAGSLAKVGIEYVHVPELGIYGEMRKNLDSTEDYRKLFGFYRENILPARAGKVEMIKHLGGKKRVALLCFEADKNSCHRGVISERLEELSCTKVTHL